MKAEDLKRGERYWCWWKSRYLYFLRSYSKVATLLDEVPAGVALGQQFTVYSFEDVDGARTTLNEEQVAKLRKEAR